MAEHGAPSEVGSFPGSPHTSASAGFEKDARATYSWSLGLRSRATSKSGAANATNSASSRDSSIVLPLANPLEGHAKLLSSVRLVAARHFAGLPTPLPRCQELQGGCFGLPEGGSCIVSASHAWRNAAHPDPSGRTTRALREALAMVPPGAGGGESFLFMDFVSIPQRPWAEGQAPRTREEAARFKAAIECMHEMYFYSDYIVHLPWDDGPLEGEGIERLVPLEELRGRRPQLVRGWVQLAEDVEGLGLDVVVEIGGQAVSSVEEVEDWLARAARDGAGEAKALLRRYPFGLPNPVPADSRGWVFLERFITMVKCAMMEEEAARRVVLTPSENIFEQVITGAERLRSAAQRSYRSKDSGELKAVLEEFLQELSEKSFSAASSDKQEMESKCAAKALQGDREVVMGIMGEFVQHLSQNWSEEAALQQGLAGRAAAAAKDFLVKWTCFSEDYAEKLEEASEKSWALWPFLAVLFSPCLCAAVCLAPVEDPDQPLRSQTVWWSVVFPAMFFTCGLAMPTSFTHSYGVPLTRKVVLCVLIWDAFFVAVSGIVFYTAAELWVFPLPLTNIVATNVMLSMAPLLWFALPAECRKSSDFRWRLLYALSHYLACASLLAVLFPVLNAALPSLSEVMQALFLCNYLAAKVLIEVFASMVSKRLGADMMPNIVFDVVLCYEINVCISFLQVSNPLVVAIQVLFNLLENGYHVWSLCRLSLSKRQEQLLVSMLVTREFVELLAPLQFLGLYLVIYHYRPKNNSISCNRTEEDMERTVRYLLLSVATETAVSLATLAWLKARGHRPLRLLRGLLATRPFFWRISIVLWLFFISCQHSHAGNDLSMTFVWLKGEAEWVCGYLWRQV